MSQGNFRILGNKSLGDKIEPMEPRLPDWKSEHQTRPQALTVEHQGLGGHVTDEHT